MHEFSLCESILRQVIQRQGSLSAIRSITVAIGDLAGVDSASLSFWFPVVAAKFAAAKIELKILQVPARGHCQHCGQEFAVKVLYAPCPYCNTFADWQFLSGRELIIQSYQIAASMKEES